MYKSRMQNITKGKKSIDIVWVTVKHANASTSTEEERQLSSQGKKASALNSDAKLFDAAVANAFAKAKAKPKTKPKAKREPENAIIQSSPAKK